MNTFLIQATPRKGAQTSLYLTRRSGRNELTRHLIEATDFLSFECAYDEVMRLRDTLSFSDVTLSVLK
jgi:hypothetical protein